MRGEPGVLDFLNKGLRHELTAINQYWLHYRIFDNWSYREFAKIWRKESMEEMRHADRLVTRILFLDGSPNMQSLDQLRIGRDVKTIMECDLAAEMDARLGLRFLQQGGKTRRIVEQAGVGRRTGTGLHRDHCQLVPGRGNFRQPCAAVKKEEDSDAVGRLHSGWKKQRA